MKQECRKCAYAWNSRKDRPKACPACKVRLDAGKWATHNNTTNNEADE